MNRYSKFINEDNHINQTENRNARLKNRFLSFEPTSSRVTPVAFALLVLIVLALGVVGGCDVNAETTMPEVAQRSDLGVTEDEHQSFRAALDQGDEFLTALHQNLRSKYGAKWDGTAFSLTNDNQLPDNWLAQTPNVWGKMAKDVRTDAGIYIAEDVRASIAGADTFVDITSLMPFPDGKFKSAIIDGLTALSKSGKQVTVRILVGYYSTPLNVQKKYLQSLIEKLKGIPKANLEIYVGVQSTNTFWNHSKMVAVDGKKVLVGGENLWSGDYLGRTPVHDLNLLLEGGIAYDMHHFADELWKSVCQYSRPDWTSAHWKSGMKDTDKKCLAKSKLVKIPGPGSTSVLGAGRFGPLVSGVNPADDAMLLSMRASTSSIRLSQQALINVGLVWKPGFQELAKALVRKNDVYIVLSNEGAKTKTGGHYESGSFSTTANRIKNYVAAEPDAPKGKALVDLLCDKLHLAPLRFGPSDEWPEKYKFGNHAKFLMVDDKVLYVGSENIYPADLMEYGVFIGNPDTVNAMREQYWEQLWGNSKRKAISGSDAPSCVFH